MSQTVTALDRDEPASTEPDSLLIVPDSSELFEAAALAAPRRPFQGSSRRPAVAGLTEVFGPAPDEAALSDADLERCFGPRVIDLMSASNGLEDFFELPARQPLEDSDWDRLFSGPRALKAVNEPAAATEPTPIDPPRLDSLVHGLASDLQRFARELQALGLDTVPA